MDNLSPSISISDEDARVFIKSILARNELLEHRCETNWCPHYDPECDEAEKMSDNDEHFLVLALSLIKKYVRNDETISIKAQK